MMATAIKTAVKDSLSFQPPCILTLEAVDKPPARRAGRAVGPIHGQHCYDVALRRSALIHDLNERTAR